MVIIDKADQRRTTGKWYVIRVEPRADSLAARELHQAGYEVVFPRVKVASQSRTDADAPRFPGYLFLRCDLEGGQRPSFQEAPHVSGWVNFGSFVPSVPDETVAELTNRVREINSQGGLWQRFKPGDRVFISSNQVQSLAEVVEEAKSPESRVRVLLQFMDRLVSAQVPWQDLQPVGEGSHEVVKVPRRTRGKGRWIGIKPQGTSSTSP